MFVRTGSCTPAEQAKNFCDHSFDVIDGENMTHTFLCQSDTVRKNGSVSVACYNNVWTPTSTRCTRKNTLYRMIKSFYLNYIILYYHIIFMFKVFVNQ